MEHGVTVQQQTLTEIEIVKFVTHRSWKYLACLEESCMEVKTVQREAGPGARVLLGLQVECFGVPRPKPDWSIQTKEQSFGKLLGTHI